MTAIYVEGLRELQRDLARAARDVGREMRDELIRAVEPARQAAESEIVATISNITPRWSQVRTGATQKAVYLAPRARRAGGSPRPNLGGLLIVAMFDAVEAKGDEIVDNLDNSMGSFLTKHNL